MNTGWAFGAFDKTLGVLSLTSCGVSRLVGEETVWDESSIASGVWRFVYVLHQDKLERLNNQGEVLVEFQYPMWEKPHVYSYLKNKVVEVALKSHFRPDRVRSVSASIVKNRYNLATGSHGENKRLMPIWCLKRLGPEVYHSLMNGIRTEDRHHVCDAICQMIYWLEISNNWPINSINFSPNEDSNAVREGGQELPPREQGPPLEAPPPSNYELKNKGNRRVKPKTTGERTVSAILSLGRGGEGKKSRRQSPWKP